ncbi:MAG: hypothetical protein DRO10_01740 [Thermoprotei archaeon]|nr:MAG: hypothetical protein DRO10_01740 [Thermoprotei archaeon]
MVTKVSGHTVALAFAGVLIVLTVITSLLILYADSQGADYYFFIYGSSECPHCRRLEAFMESTYGPSRYHFCDVSTNQACLEYFKKFLGASGLPGSVPMTMAFKQGYLMGIVIGEDENKSFWDSIVAAKPSPNVTIYMGEEPAAYLVLELDKHKQFIREFIPEPQASLILGSPPTGTTPAPPSGGEEAILASLIPLALSDSVNPCTFVLYGVILLSVSISAGRRAVAATGISFILGVFLSYLILGLVLTEVVGLIPRPLLLAFAFAFAVYLIITSLRIMRHPEKRKMCKEDDPSCPSSGLYNMFKKKGGIIGAFLIGIVASFTLLPCSAGPYLVFASLLSLSEWIARLGYLLVYVLIFISPLILILLGALGLTKVRGVNEYLLKHEAKIKLGAGIVLVLVAAYLALL